MTRGLSRILMTFVMTILTWGALHPLPCDAQSYNIKTYRYQDGVISNIVFNAIQDQYGNIWFATRNGLTVYDGVEWSDAGDEYVNSPRSEGLVSLDQDGVVWWASLRAPFRVSRLVDGGWQDIPVHGVDEKKWQLVGFRTYTDSQGRTIAALASIDGTVLLWNESKWTTFSTEKLTRVIFSMELDQKNLLLATGAGLLKIDRDSPEKIMPLAAGLPSGPVFAVAPDKASAMTWVVGGDWVARLKENKLDILFPTPGLIINLPFSKASACLSPEGGLYYVDSSHTFIFHPEFGLEHLTRASGVVTNDGLFVMADREQNIWITSQRGISKISSRSLAGYNHRQGLLKNEVSAVIERASGEIVLGHLGGLTFHGPTPRTLEFEPGPGLFSRVMDMAEDEDEILWVAARRKGLGRLTGSDEIRWFGSDDGLPLPVYSVLPRMDNVLFAGTRSGVYRKNGSRFEKISLPGVPDDALPYIRRLVPLASGGLLIATKTHGLFTWVDGAVTGFDNSGIVGLPNVFTAFENADGSLWAGTQHGLCVVKNGKLEYATAPDPEIRRPIYGILRDNKGQIWFGTDEGVVIWDGTSQKRITTREGLLGSETNRAALKLDSRGHVWIGTESGVSVYRSEYDLDRSTAPVLSLTGVIINGEQYPIDEPLQVQGPLGSLILEFRAPYFTSEEPLGFRARTTHSSLMDIPMIVTWPGVLNLTNVLPGSFQVQVEARTPSGLLTNKLTTPMIIITPPVLERWFTRLAMGLLGAFLLYLVFAFFTGRRYSQRLEEEVGHRTKELRQSEEMSRLESERLSGTLESISDGVVVVDGQGRVVLFNHAAESMFLKSSNVQLGCALEEILPLQFMADSDQARRYKALLKDPAGIRLFNEQVSVQGPENRTSWFEISAVPINRAPGGLVFAFRNITSRLNQEERELRTQKLESLGLLAGGIAHDFNNLLTIMLGNLSLVTSTLVTTDAENDQLQKIRQASERARSLTHQLLTFAKGGTPVIKPSDVARIIRDSARFNLSGSSVDFSFNMPEGTLWANVDADQISQMIGNLVINAVQAMPDGGRLDISARTAEHWPEFADDTQVIAVFVEDTGVGISEEDQKKIFDPYFTTKTSGSGLGLAIVHSIVQKHGGSLSVDSSLGKGSSFCVVLPACDPDPEIKPSVSVIAEGASYQKPRVLFMDDELDIRSIMAGMLTHMKYEYEVVAHGEAALAAFTKARDEGRPFGVVLLDLTIPGGMGGRDTAKALGRLDATVPLIVASGYNEDPVMAGFEDYGFSGVLMKPFDLHDLQEILFRVVSEK